MAKKQSNKHEPANDSFTVPVLGILDLGGSNRIDLDAILCRDFEDISEACEKLPGILEWINIHLQKYVEQKLLLGRLLKETEARAWLDYKMGRFQEEFPSITVTEKAIDKASLLVPEVMSIHKKLAKYVAWVDRLQNLQLSLQMKYDLVRSSEATRRRAFDEPDQPSSSSSSRHSRPRLILSDDDDD